MHIKGGKRKQNKNKVAWLSPVLQGERSPTNHLNQGTTPSIAWTSYFSVCAALMVATKYRVIFFISLLISRQIKSTFFFLIFPIITQNSRFTQQCRWRFKSFGKDTILIGTQTPNNYWIIDTLSLSLYYDHIQHCKLIRFGFITCAKYWDSDNVGQERM